MRHGLGMLAALACASIGVAGVAPVGADGTVREDRRKRNRRAIVQTSKPAREQHAGTREIARRQRQEAKRAKRTDAQ